MVYSYGFTQLDALIQLWQAQGLFSVFLPFLLIFAVTFAVLNKSRILGGKSGIDVIVAITVGLLALQQPYLSQFFSTVIPNLGMGIAVLITLVILVGLFITSKTEHVWMIILGSVAFIVFLVVIISTQNQFSPFAWGWWSQWGNIVVWGIILIGIIVAFSLANKGPEPKSLSER